jgi:hypothetical protein
MVTGNSVVVIQDFLSICLMVIWNILIGSMHSILKEVTAPRLNLLSNLKHQLRIAKFIIVANLICILLLV